MLNTYLPPDPVNSCLNCARILKKKHKIYCQADVEALNLVISLYLFLIPVNDLFYLSFDDSFEII